MPPVYRSVLIQQFYFWVNDFKLLIKFGNSCLYRTKQLNLQKYRTISIYYIYFVISFVVLHAITNTYTNLESHLKRYMYMQDEYKEHKCATKQFTVQAEVKQ